MKISSIILALGFLSVWRPVSGQAETWFEFSQERRHLGFTLAQGLSGDPQAALSEYTRDQGLLDGARAAESKWVEEKWFWAGYLSGFSTLGLLEFPFLSARSNTPLPQKEHKSIQGKGRDYIEGFQESYQKHIHAKRKSRVEEGTFWGICTLAGTATVGTLLLIFVF